MPATTFKAMFTDASPGTWSTSRAARPWPTRPRPPSIACWAGSTASTPLTTGRWASGTPARTSASPTTSPSGIQLFLGIIGALTLFVGGMGVANIMYAVVKERTREIGVKMALGAKVRQVMAPFVLEALIMTVVGGIAGDAGRGGSHGRCIALLPLKGDAFDFMGRPTFSPAIAAGHHRHPGRHRNHGRLLSRPARRPRQPGRVAALRVIEESP